jgi:hypothetical protein
MSEHVLTDAEENERYLGYLEARRNQYVSAVMQPERPRFNPYVIRRENRLLLAVPGNDQEPIRTFELDAVELTRLLVGAHEALRGYVTQMQEGL